MRQYRAAMPWMRHSKIEQAPLVGPGWPRVVGTPLSQLGPEKSGIAGMLASFADSKDTRPSTGNQLSMTGFDNFSVYILSTALCFALGKSVHRAFYVGSVGFGLLAAWKAFRTYRGSA